MNNLDKLIVTLERISGDHIALQYRPAHEIGAPVGHFAACSRAHTPSFREGRGRTAEEALKVAIQEAVCVLQNQADMPSPQDKLEKALDFIKERHGDDFLSGVLP